MEELVVQNIDGSDYTQSEIRYVQDILEEKLLLMNAHAHFIGDTDY